MDITSSYISAFTEKIEKFIHKKEHLLHLISSLTMEWWCIVQHGHPLDGAPRVSRFCPIRYRSDSCLLQAVYQPAAVCMAIFLNRHEGTL